jgi:predicted amidohydrolase
MPKIPLAQLSMSENMSENLDKVLQSIAAAGKADADLVVFPEISLSPFFPQHENFNAKPYLLNRESPEIGTLCEASKQANINSIPNVYLSEGGKNYDASLMIDRHGQILGISKMVYITQFPGFYEQNYYAPSDGGFQVFETDFGLVGVVICFDRHFPESIRSCVLKGADLIVIPTVNRKGEQEEMFEWELRVAAFQNSVAIAMCNRVGIEGNSHYYGKSILVGPLGNVVIKAGESEGLFWGGFDPKSIRQIRKANPYLNLYDPSVFDLKAYKHTAGR